MAIFLLQLHQRAPHCLLALNFLKRILPDECIKRSQQDNHNSCSYDLDHRLCILPSELHRRLYRGACLASGLSFLQSRYAEKGCNFRASTADKVLNYLGMELNLVLTCTLDGNRIQLSSSPIPPNIEEDPDDG